MVPLERALVSSYKLSTHIISVLAIFCPKFQIVVLGGVAIPQFWGREAVPFQGALVSFYRPPIVTFPLDLRVSEILPLLFSSMPLFSYPTSSLSKIFPHVPLGLGGSFFGHKERRCWASCPCNQFPRFLTYVITIRQRQRQTDRRTDDMRSQDRAFALKCIAR